MLERERKTGFGTVDDFGWQIIFERPAEGNLGLFWFARDIFFVHRQCFGAVRDLNVGVGRPPFDPGEHGRAIKALEKVGQVHSALEPEMRLQGRIGWSIRTDFVESLDIVLFEMRIAVGCIEPRLAQNARLEFV